MNVREAFVFQGEACRALGSPFMGRLMPMAAERLTPRTEVGDRVLRWQGDPSPYGDSVPLRLAGALHALKLDGLALSDVYPPNRVGDDRLWAAVEAALEEHAARLLAWLDRPPQTNEVRRAAALLPALAHLNARYGQPVGLLELGTSAGLNLRADQFCLVLPERMIGRDGSGVTVQPGWTGVVPAGDLPEVVDRRGVDLLPVDPESADGRLRLLAYLWPDQPERIARTEAAIEIARETPAQVDAGDAGTWLEAMLGRPAEGHLRVVCHTIAWQYFPQDTKDRALAAMKGTTEPLACIGMEADGGEGAALTLTHYPSGEVEELARADFHGRWVNWRA